MSNRSADLGDLLVQMKITNRMLAAQLKLTMSQGQIVSLLASTGASYQDIADILGTSVGVIATTLSRIKKGAKKAQ